jgi:hypothetical protein
MTYAWEVGEVVLRRTSCYNRTIYTRVLEGGSVWRSAHWL